MHEDWWLAGDAREVIEARSLRSVAMCMAAAARGKTLSSDRQSAAVCLAGEPPLLLKWRRPRAGRRWRTFFRPSRELKEARALLGVRSLGFLAPEPLAVGERRRGPELLGAVLVRPFLPALETARALLAREGEGRAWENLAHTLARWHDAGFRHGDCYPKNVLVDPAGGEALAIGAPSAVFRRPGPHLDSRRLKDLAQWGAGLAALGGREDALSFLPPYAEAAGLGKEAAALAAAVRPPFERILEKKARRRATQPRREPHGAPSPVPLPEAEAPVERRFHDIDDLRVRLPRRSRRGERQKHP